LQPANGNDSVASASPAAGRGTWTAARLARGLLLFVALTAVGFGILWHRGTLGSGGLSAMRRVHPAALVVGGLQALLDVLLGGMRIWLCARALGQSIRPWPCALANCANIFMGGVTPSQHAGGPAQIWILMRNGLGFTEATVTSFCTYLGTVSFFLVLAVALALGRGALPMAGALQLFTRGSVMLFAGTMCVAALALPRPDAVIRVLHALLARFPRLGPRVVASAGVRGFERLLRDYSVFVRRAVRRGKLPLLAVLVLSGLIYLNKFFVAYVVVRGLGLHPRVHDVLYLAALQSLVTYFAPTPGASGVAEVTAAELMRRVVPDSSLGAYVVLWRALSLYLGMTLGAVTTVLTGFASLRAPSSPPDGVP